MRRIIFPLLLLFPFVCSAQKQIMAVFAHPDDEAVTNVSALLAKYAREGNTVYLVIVTKGELGTNAHAKVPAGDSLAFVRAGEAQCAAKALGIQPVILAGLGDGSLAKDFTGSSTHKKLDSIFRSYQPDMIITWGPDGGYGHMDHRTVHNVVTELVQAGNLPKQPQLFYAAFPTEVWKEWKEKKSGKVWMYNNWNTVSKKLLTVKIQCNTSDQQKAVQAMYCHWSQFTKEEMEETQKWMESTKGIVYLRAFK